jgi:hypothetical protein
LEKKHAVGNRLVFEKNQIPGKVKKIPVLLSHSSLSLFFLWAEVSKYFNKSWGIWADASKCFNKSWAAK